MNIELSCQNRTWYYNFDHCTSKLLINYLQCQVYCWDNVLLVIPRRSRCQYLVQGCIGHIYQIPRPSPPNTVVIFLLCWLGGPRNLPILVVRVATCLQTPTMKESCTHLWKQHSRRDNRDGMGIPLILLTARVLVASQSIVVSLNWRAEVVDSQIHFHMSKANRVDRACDLHSPCPDLQVATSIPRLKACY